MSDYGNNRDLGSSRGRRRMQQITQGASASHPQILDNQRRGRDEERMARPEGAPPQGLGQRRSHEASGLYRQGEQTQQAIMRSRHNTRPSTPFPGSGARTPSEPRVQRASLGSESAGDRASGSRTPGARVQEGSLRRRYTHSSAPFQGREFSGRQPTPSPEPRAQYRSTGAGSADVSGSRTPIRDASGSRTPIRDASGSRTPAARAQEGSLRRRYTHSSTPFQGREFYGRQPTPSPEPRAQYRSTGAGSANVSGSRTPIRDASGSRTPRGASRSRTPVSLPSFGRERDNKSQTPPQTRESLSRRRTDSAGSRTGSLARQSRGTPSVSHRTSGSLKYEARLKIDQINDLREKIKKYYENEDSKETKDAISLLYLKSSTLLLRNPEPVDNTRFEKIRKDFNLVLEYLKEQKVFFGPNSITNVAERIVTEQNFNLETVLQAQNSYRNNASQEENDEKSRVAVEIENQLYKDAFLKSEGDEKERLQAFCNVLHQISYTEHEDESWGASKAKPGEIKAWLEDVLNKVKSGDISAEACETEVKKIFEDELFYLSDQQQQSKEVEKALSEGMYEAIRDQRGELEAYLSGSVTPSGGGSRTPSSVPDRKLKGRFSGSVTPAGSRTPPSAPDTKLKANVGSEANKEAAANVALEIYEMLTEASSSTLKDNLSELYIQVTQKTDWTMSSASAEKIKNDIRKIAEAIRDNKLKLQPGRSLEEKIAETVFTVFANSPLPDLQTVQLQEAPGESDGFKKFIKDLKKQYKRQPDGVKKWQIRRLKDELKEYLLENTLSSEILERLKILNGRLALAQGEDIKAIPVRKTVKRIFDGENPDYGFLEHQYKRREGILNAVLSKIEDDSIFKKAINKGRQSAVKIEYDQKMFDELDNYLTQILTSLKEGDRITDEGFFMKTIKEALSEGEFVWPFKKDEAGPS